MDRIDRIQRELNKMRKRLEKTITKSKAKEFATKWDFKRTVTVKDMEKFLGKEEAQKFFVTRFEFEESLAHVKEKVFTREEFFEYLHRFDDVLQEMRDVRDSRLIFEKQFVELDDTVAGHGKRITKIEDKIGAL
jgi:hypothetical protein